jgi:hypothetical protein
LPEYNFNDQTHTTHFKTSYLTAFHPLSNFTASQLSLLNSTPIFELVSQNQVQELSLAFQADYDDIDSSIGPVTVSKSPTQTSIMLDAPIPSVITANFAIDLMPEGQFTFIDSLFERPHMDEYLSIQYHPKNEEFFDSLPTSINTSQVEKNVLINKMIDAIGLELDISLPAKSLDPIEDKTHYFASDKITNALFYEIAFLIDKMPSHSCHELNISLNALYSLAFDENYMNTFEEMSFFNNIYDHHELYFFSEEMNAAETIIY